MSINPAQSQYMDRYLQQVWDAPVLSREREVELAHRMKNPGRDGQRARDELVVAHLKLATKLARKYARSGRSFEDLIQEANIGLLEAADRFDVEKGFRFSTYAFHWVRQQLNLYVKSSDGDVRIPPTMLKQIRQLKDAISALKARGELVSDQALAARMKVTVERVREITEHMFYEVSLNTPVGEGGDTELGALIADPNADDPEQLLLDENRRVLLERALATLPQRDREILTMRYGLDGEGERTLEEVSAMFNVTRERIRQIQQKALGKLSRSKPLNVC